uniref:Sterol O-acyltransferase 1-like n=1 Tax=Dermatophagoides pteronyssinus TaxID=6956 RepID=A0A6P6YBW4_DERPT|nr:sterol O-acyltransferase 1-like [Dermatophagoides pteronyssinus]
MCFPNLLELDCSDIQEINLKEIRFDDNDANRIKLKNLVLNRLKDKHITVDNIAKLINRFNPSEVSLQNSLVQFSQLLNLFSKSTSSIFKKLTITNNSINAKLFLNNTSKLNKLQTFSRLVRFIYIPALVYEIDFPRSTGKFRKKYFFLKLISTITVFNIYIYLIYYKYPDLMRAQSQNHLITLITSYCSILIESVMLIFLFMFDGILNLLAEATRFPDRQFYGFWWNSTTFIEFSRDWNTPVYRWLHVYIYKASLGYFKKHNKILSVLLTLTP